jgi:nucleotide-binding universal stress UspA family protein
VNPSIRSILHPTDFSAWSYEAYAHALRLALATKSKLYILHVLESEVGECWESPQVRLHRLLVQWGILNQMDSIAVIEQKLGFEIENFTFRQGYTPADEIVHFLNQHTCDLIVLATEDGGEGLDRLLRNSAAESVFRRSRTPTLFLTHGGRRFVDQVTGRMKLRHVLVPIDHSPLAFRAFETANEFPRLMTGVASTVQLLHVGSKAPHIGPNPVTIWYGNVVQTIVDAAVEYDVALICMPTAGHHGVLDALRGSTTERVLRQATRPLLAISTT